MHPRMRLGIIAGILVLTVFALLLDGIVTLVEGRLQGWQPAARRAQPAASGAGAGSAFAFFRSSGSTRM